MSGDLKKTFNKYKTRQSGGDTAGFVLTAKGEMDIIEPTKMKSMNPQKLKALLKEKGIAGWFGKAGSDGIVFSIMAGKMGGMEGQPWVKRHIKDNLGTSNFDITTDSNADVDPDPTTLGRSTTTTTTTTSEPNELSEGLDLLSLEEEEEEEDTLLDNLPEEEEEEEEDPLLEESLSLLDSMDLEEDEDVVDPELLKDWIKVARAMADAVDDMNSGLGKLRTALMKSGDEELEEIAETFFGTGFPEIHGGHKVSFTSKLMDVERQSTATGYKAALESLQSEASSYLDHLKSSKKVEVCDDNPSHKVGIVTIMSKAIGNLQTEANRQISAH